MSDTIDVRFFAALADRYVIDRKLGSGGMGNVYLARDVKHGRQVAIKAMPSSGEASPDVDAFLREIRLTARLQHPHILPLLDSGEAAGCPFYVMPYVKGGSLRDLLNARRRLPLREAMDLVRGVAEALQYAHESRVVHCDVKPENILLSAGHAVVADFGVSRALYAEGRPWRADVGGWGGTPAYVSPEVASGERDVDHRADVFSLACVVFEMLAGRCPFDGDNDQAVVASRFARSSGGRWDGVAGVPDAVRLVLSRALAVDAARRFPSARHFFRGLERSARLGVNPLGHQLSALWITLRVLLRRLRRLADGQRRVTAQRLLAAATDSLAVRDRTTANPV